MKTTNERLLCNPDVYPSSEVISDALGEANNAYLKFMDSLADHDLQLEWRYYNDGKSWLGKGLYRWRGSRGANNEITVFWLSVWKGFFKVTIYFPGKVRCDLLNLPLDEEVRNIISNSNQMGKLNFFPVTFDLCSDEMFDAVFTLMDYRKTIK